MACERGCDDPPANVTSARIVRLPACVSYVTHWARGIGHDGGMPQTIPAEELTAGDTILLGGFTDQPMRVVSVRPAGRTRIHVVISSDITFSYRRRERVVIDRKAQPSMPTPRNTFSAGDRIRLTNAGMDAFREAYGDDPNEPMPTVREATVTSAGLYGFAVAFDDGTVWGSCGAGGGDEPIYFERI